jgi:hypothetical protein
MLYSVGENGDYFSHGFFFKLLLGESWEKQGHSCQGSPDLQRKTQFMLIP